MRTRFVSDNVKEENASMRKILIASACVMALSGAAFAQTQPAPGASSSGNVGPGAAAPDARTGTTGMNNGMMRPGDQPSGRR